MPTLLLLRHGHIAGIDPPRFRGREDVTLSEQGRRQAQAAAAHVAAGWKPTIVYTSPLQRCVQTGQAVASACGISAEALAELNDIDYGAWQWQTHDEVRARWPTEFERWFSTPQRIRFPGGESLQDLDARVAEALRKILQRPATDTVVIVGHDSSNRVLLMQMLELPLSAYWRLAQDPCGLSQIEIDAARVQVVRINAAVPPAP